MVDGCADELRDAALGLTQTSMAHACKIETSVMLAIRLDLCSVRKGPLGQNWWRGRSSRWCGTSAPCR